MQKSVQARAGLTFQVRMTVISLAVLVLLLTSSLLLTPAPAAAQALPTPQYVRETGHTIQGAFLLFYQQEKHALILYGLPLTDEFVNQRGEVVQYFQRAIFRRTANSNAVSLDPVGVELYAVSPGTPVAVNPLPADHPACHRPTENSPLVCYAFKDFYLQYGGEKRFGLSLSPIVSVNGRLTQYFEYARFEWHPDLPSGQRVKLSEVGYLSFLYRKENPGLLSPVPPVLQSRTERPLGLKVEASPVNGTVEVGQQQTLYAVVRDQTLQPVNRAFVTFTLRPSSGQPQTYTGFTDANGILFITIPASPANVIPKGRVLVEVEATLNNNLKQTTRTSYTVW